MFLFPNFVVLIVVLLFIYVVKTWFTVRTMEIDVANRRLNLEYEQFALVREQQYMLMQAHTEHRAPMQPPTKVRKGDVS